MIPSEEHNIDKFLTYDPINETAHSSKVKKSKAKKLCIGEVQMRSFHSLTMGSCLIHQISTELYLLDHPTNV